MWHRVMVGTERDTRWCTYDSDGLFLWCIQSNVDINRHKHIYFVTMHTHSTSHALGFYKTLFIYKFYGHFFLAFQLRVTLSEKSTPW